MERWREREIPPPVAAGDPKRGGCNFTEKAAAASAAGARGVLIVNNEEDAESGGVFEMTLPDGVGRADVAVDTSRMLHDLEPTVTMSGDEARSLCNTSSSLHRSTSRAA